MRRLTEVPTRHAEKGNLVQRLAQSELKGPNGRQPYLVIEALEPRIEPSKLSAEVAWELARQLVEATAYFHDLGIAYSGIFLVS